MFEAGGASMRDKAAALYRSVQEEICKSLEAVDGEGRFHEDEWERPGGGGGQTRVMKGGRLFESAGVNWSEVYGELPPHFNAGVKTPERSFYATGISLVLHPLTPHIPTVHANFRFLQRGDLCWFGGGADLTPYYPHLEDAQHFHRTLKGGCDQLNPAWYPRFKSWCDDYFYLPHRKETRGIGGIFYDYVGVSRQALEHPDSHPHALEEEVSIERGFEFASTISRTFLPAYLPIVERRQDEPYGQRERDFQLYRRGRYVEFNLIYDRGTTFGLKTGGRTESILMSMPPMARWEYQFQGEEGSREAALQQFLTPRDWLAEQA